MPARIGSFTGPTFQYGQPLSIVHPVDNAFETAKYFPELLNEPGLTAAEKEELQKEYDDLLGALLLARDWYSET